MSAAPSRPLSPTEYLVRERQAPFRSEYFRGETYAMAGASYAHNRVKENLAIETGARLKGSPCQSFSSDMRVKVDATGLYAYPDVVIVCGQPAFEDAAVDTLLNPIVIIEVLSDSTEKYDRGFKFAQYRLIPSLREFVLVSQDKMMLERYVRQDDGDWKLTEFSNPAGEFAFASVPVRFPLAEVYRGVELPAESAGGAIQA